MSTFNLKKDFRIVYNNENDLDFMPVHFLEYSNNNSNIEDDTFLNKISKNDSFYTTVYHDFLEHSENHTTNENVINNEIKATIKALYYRYYDIINNKNKDGFYNDLYNTFIDIFRYGLENDYKKIDKVNKIDLINHNDYCLENQVKDLYLDNLNKFIENKIKLYNYEIKDNYSYNKNQFDKLFNIYIYNVKQLYKECIKDLNKLKQFNLYSVKKDIEKGLKSFFNNIDINQLISCDINYITLEIKNNHFNIYYNLDNDTKNVIYNDVVYNDTKEEIEIYKQVINELKYNRIVKKRLI